MAKEIKVKPDFAQHEVGFLGKFTPLGEMSSDSLHEYYKMIKHHNIASELAMFDVGETANAPAAVQAPTVAPVTKPKKKVVAAKAKKATAAVHKQTPSTEAEAIAVHNANEAGAAVAPSSTSVTDNTSITPTA